MKRILRYLKGTSNHGIKFISSPESKLIGYSDSDFANHLSVSGCIFMLQDNPISWSSRKQTTVTLSTAEAEYTALSSAAQEAVWLSQLLTDLNEAPSKHIIIFEDNQGVIYLSKNSEFHRRTKYLKYKSSFNERSDKVKYYLC